jgi:hypothetical protein
MFLAATPCRHPGLVATAAALDVVEAFISEHVSPLVGSTDHDERHYCRSGVRAETEQYQSLAAYSALQQGQGIHARLLQTQ